MNEKICKMVTDRIMQKLDQGVIPWRQPWVATGGAVSHATGRQYSLLNQMLLDGYGEYATFLQIKEEGVRVKKGAKAKTVVFWKLMKYGIDVDDEVEPGGYEPGTRTFPLLRYYNVFSLEDAEGVEAKYLPDLPNIASKDAAAEKIALDYLTREGINLIEGEIRDEAVYRVLYDEIAIPNIMQFRSTALYYSTLFHEITHSTGAAKRLDRKFTSDRTTQKRALEELIAEMGAAVLSAHAGILSDDTLANNAAYIDWWRDQIANDNTLVILAAGRAQKAVDYVLNGPQPKQTDNCA